MGKLRNFTGEVREFANEFTNMIDETQREIFSDFEKQYRRCQKRCNIVSFLVFVACMIVVVIKAKG